MDISKDNIEKLLQIDNIQINYALKQKECDKLKIESDLVCDALYKARKYIQDTISKLTKEGMSQLNEYLIEYFESNVNKLYKSHIDNKIIIIKKNDFNNTYINCSLEESKQYVGINLDASDISFTYEFYFKLKEINEDENKYNKIVIINGEVCKK